jgi:hypothetical protein
LYGFIDHIGNKVIEPQFMYAQNFTEGLALVVVDTIYGECVDSLAYKNTGEKTSKEPCLFVKYGYIDKSGKFVIEPKLLASLFVNKEDIGKIDLKISNINHDLLGKYAFGSKRALYQDTTTWKYGYIDCNGKIVIPPKYEYAKRFRQSRAVALKYTGKPTGPQKMKCHYGVIDENDSVIADFIYYEVTDYGSNHTIVRKMEKNEEANFDLWADIVLILNKEGQIVDSLSSFNTYYGFTEGISVCRSMFLSNYSQKENLEYIDTLGHYLKPLDGISEEQANEYFVSKQIFSVIPEDKYFMGCTYFSSNLAAATMNGEVWFFIDRHLLVRGKGLEDTYEHIKPFNDGLAAVKKDGKWGYVNTSLKRVIQCKYDSCEMNYGFLEKVYTFKNDSVISMYINKKDSVVWEYTSLRGLENKYNNIDSQKSKMDYGKWKYNETNIYSHHIEYYIVVVVVLIVVFAYIRYYNRKNKK